MKIKYLGTAAAEGVPALVCNCEQCTRARSLGEVRTRSQSLIDGKLLIDFGPDTYCHMMKYGLDILNIRNILITHSHADHLTPTETDYFNLGYAHYDEKNTRFCFYGGKTAEGLLNPFLGRCKNASYTVLKPFDTVKIDKYTVTALRAYHDPGSDPLLYVISDGDKTLMYCNDTGWFPEETWEYIENNPFHADFVSLDCTSTMDTGDTGHHMSIETNMRVRDRLYELGIADQSTVFCINHFSHNGRCAVPTDTDKLAAENGFVASRDGAEFEF